ncbi:MAG TPA: ATP-binding protein [Gemmatimonadaceae bacterium]|nr:ATP-binding protein [Gemmatimonadaceae bacterium]
MASDRESGIGNRESRRPGNRERGNREAGTGNRRSRAGTKARAHPPLEVRLPLIVLGGGLPGVVISLIWLWTGEHGMEVRWTLSVLVVVAWLAAAALARERVVRPLQTLSNLLSALREGDFSVRGAGANEEDALGIAMTEVNALGNTLQSQRLGAMEATALLRTVMAEIDSAIFAFDAAGKLRLINREGERVLGQPYERLLGREADALGLGVYLREDAPRTLETMREGRTSRWDVRRREFRQDGLPHRLLVLTDVSHVLREEERLAWQRIVRVLSHEINNSLAPIKSIARSLQRVIRREPRLPDWEPEVLHGLDVIEGRSGSLSRFLQAYARLAQLPKPVRRPVDVESWVRHVVDLEERVAVTVCPGPPTTVNADRDQLDQLLINIVRNAVDAVADTGGGVRVSWTADDTSLVLDVDDEGHGLSDTANLFVPFFTTKPNGTGIGLALSRQIAEAHDGVLTLGNRVDPPGVRARLRLPLR